MLFFLFFCLPRTKQLLGLTISEPRELEGSCVHTACGERSRSRCAQQATVTTPTGARPSAVIEPGAVRVTPDPCTEGTTVPRCLISRHSANTVCVSSLYDCHVGWTTTACSHAQTMYDMLQTCLRRNNSVVMFAANAVFSMIYI